MGICSAAEKKNDKGSPQSNFKQDPPSVPPIKTASVKQPIIKFSNEEKSEMINAIQNTTSEKLMSDCLKQINVSFVKRLAKIEVNLVYLIKNLPVEQKGGKTDEELYADMDNDQCREKYKFEFKEQSFTQKSGFLENFEELETYKTEIFEGLGLNNTKNSLKELSVYKDQMIFQILISHLALFTELSNKLNTDHYESFEEIKGSVINMQNYFFSIYDYDRAEDLEKAYFDYMKEELKLFNLFHLGE